MQHENVLQDHCTDLNERFVIHHRILIALSNLFYCPLLHMQLMRREEADNLVPFYSTQIRMLAEKVLYNNIIPTDIVWLEPIHSIRYYSIQRY